MREETSPQNVPYYEIPGFEEVFLEDSWVMDIQDHPSGVTFFLNAVLREKHPLYQPRLPGQQYCYRGAHLKFRNPSKVNWVRKTMSPAVDATREIDFGNIDMFYFFSGHYYLSGEWEELDVVSAAPTIEFVDEDRAAP
jgi:hypothetical protein